MISEHHCSSTAFCLNSVPRKEKCDLRKYGKLWDLTTPLGRKLGCFTRILKKLGRLYDNGQMEEPFYVRPKYCGAYGSFEIELPFHFTAS